MADGNGATSFERLIEIGIALSAERNINRLMEMILLEAMDTLLFKGFGADPDNSELGLSWGLCARAD